jgi:hypothetical protein
MYMVLSVGCQCPLEECWTEVPGYMRVPGLADSWAHVSGPQRWLPAPQRGTWDLGSWLYASTWTRGQLGSCNWSSALAASAQRGMWDLGSRL